MYAALRAMQEALGRDDLDARHRERDLPRAGSARPDHHRRRRAARRPAGVAGRGRPPRARCRRPALRVHGVFGAAHDTDLAHQEVRFPEVPRPARHRDARTPDAPEPVRRDQLPRTDRVAAGQPARRSRQGPLPVVGAAPREREPRPARLAVHGDVLGPAVGRALGPPTRGMFMVLSLEIGIRFVRDAGDAVGAAGDRGLAHRRRLRHRPGPPVGRSGTSARSPPRPRTSGSCPTAHLRS